MTSKSIIPQENIEKKIYTIRDLRVMLDSDLAELYGVTTKALNQAVKRNPERFPYSFIFQLTQEEAELSRSQIVTLNKPALEEGTPKKRGQNIKYLPHAFTEHGVLQLSNVLKSARAIRVSIQIIEAFVRIRQMVLSIPELEKKLEEIEARLADHDFEFKAFHEIILPLLIVNNPPRRKAGFNPGEKK